jgi:hypothetical protein
MSFYVMRHNQQPTGHLERLVLRTDGFASLHAPFAGGEMVTKGLQCSGHELVLNYATGAAGYVRVELQDPSGNAYPGYALQASELMIGNHIEHVVRWESGTDVSALAGRPVRMRLELKDADVYAFQFR